MLVSVKPVKLQESCTFLFALVFGVCVWKVRGVIRPKGVGGKRTKQDHVSEEVSAAQSTESQASQVDQNWLIKGFHRTQTPSHPSATMVAPNHTHLLLVLALFASGIASDSFNDFSIDNIVAVEEDGIEPSRFQKFIAKFEQEQQINLEAELEEEEETEVESSPKVTRQVEEGPLMTQLIHPLEDQLVHPLEDEPWTRQVENESLMQVPDQLLLYFMTT